MKKLLLFILLNGLMMSGCSHNYNHSIKSNILDGEYSIAQDSGETLIYDKDDEVKSISINTNYSQLLSSPDLFDFVLGLNYIYSADELNNVITYTFPVSHKEELLEYANNKIKTYSYYEVSDNKIILSAIADMKFSKNVAEILTLMQVRDSLQGNLPEYYIVEFKHGLPNSSLKIELTEKEK